MLRIPGYVTLLLLMTCIAACSKSTSDKVTPEKPEPAKPDTIKQPEPEVITPLFEGTYVSAITAEVGKLKLYKRSGTTDNELKVQAFLEAEGFMPALFTGETTADITPGIFKVTINAKREANVEQHFILEEKVTEVEFSGKLEDVTATELIIRSNTTDTVFAYNSLLPLDVAKPITPAPVFHPVGTNGYLRFYNRQRLIIHNGELYLPMVVYCGKQVKSSYSSKIFGLMYNNYNIVNPELSSLLAGTDGIVAQEFLIKLEKQ